MFWGRLDPPPRYCQKRAPCEFRVRARGGQGAPKTGAIVDSLTHASKVVPEKYGPSKVPSIRLPWPSFARSSLTVGVARRSEGTLTEGLRRKTRGAKLLGLLRNACDVCAGGQLRSVLRGLYRELTANKPVCATGRVGWLVVSGVLFVRWVLFISLFLDCYWV